MPMAGGTKKLKSSRPKAPLGCSVPVPGSGNNLMDLDLDQDRSHCDLDGAAPLAALGSLLELPSGRAPTGDNASVRFRQQAAKPRTVKPALAGLIPSGADHVAVDATAGKKPRVKASDLDATAVDAKVTSKYACGSLKDLSIPEMQCFLRSKGQPVGGKKAELEQKLFLLLQGG